MKFEKYKAYKYIRLDTDEFKFTILTLFGQKHSDLVEEGEKAISAGTISINKDDFTLLNTGSKTLKIYSSQESDFPLLEKIVGKPYRQSSY